jgi:phosphoesterase RecJ-like protein
LSPATGRAGEGLVRYPLPLPPPGPVPGEDQIMFDQVKKAIASGSRFVLVTHLNADGDGLGAELALGRFLRRHGKQVRIINTDPIPKQYRFLLRGDEPELFDPAKHGPALNDADAIIILDNSSETRLAGMSESIVKSPVPKICIDHHPHPDREWDVMAIDDRACATGEIIYNLIVEMDGDIAPEDAEPIYVSIVTDTGNFRFSNTSPRVLAIASALVAKGVNVPTVYQEIFERNPAAFVKLLGAALASIRQDPTGQLGYILMTRKMIHDCSADGEDTSDIINGVLTIDGTKVALLFKELPDGRTKVSLRSKGAVDVNRIAMEFGGGGHRNASGIVLALPLDQAVETILPRVKAQLA